MKIKDVFNAAAGVVGLALSLGIIIVAMAVAAVLLEHGWPKFLEGGTMVEWLTAIGTICAALFAVFIAASGRFLYKRDEKEKAKRYVSSARINLAQVYESLVAISSDRFDRGYQVQDLSYGETIAIQQISRLLETLRDIDVMMLATASNELSKKVILAQDTLIKAAVEIKQLDANVDEHKQEILNTLKTLKKALELIEEINNK